MPRSPFAFCFLLLLAPGRTGLAQETYFVTPQTWDRGDEHSTYQEWDVFSVQPGYDNPSAAGAHPPDVGVHTIEGAQPSVQELSGFSFITSSRNIYSFAEALDVQVDVPNYELGEGYYTTIVLQTKTLGNTIDPDTVFLGGQAPDAKATLFSGEIQSPGGSAMTVESWYRWLLPADPGNAASYALTFQALGTSMSLDRVAVDTWTGQQQRIEPIPGLSLLPGDANGDGEVDLTDFGILKDNFGAGTTADQGDFNGDGQVDLTDFGILKDNFGTAAAAAVPEPSTLGLAALAALGLAAGLASRRG